MRDRLVFVSIIAALSLNILLWIIVLGKFHAGSNAGPLHFNVVYGIDFVGPERQLYEIPAAGAVIILINYFLGRQFYEKEKLMSYFLSLASLLVQIVLAAGIASLLLLGV